MTTQESCNKVQVDLFVELPLFVSNDEENMSVLTNLGSCDKQDQEDDIDRVLFHKKIIEDNIVERVQEVKIK